jgi:hypothetical protein
MSGWATSANPYWIGMINPTQKAAGVSALMNQVSSSPAARILPAVGKNRPLSANAAKLAGKVCRTHASVPVKFAAAICTGKARNTADKAERRLVTTHSAPTKLARSASSSFAGDFGSSP